MQLRDSPTTIRTLQLRSFSDRGSGCETDTHGRVANCMTDLPAKARNSFIWENSTGMHTLGNRSGSFPEMLEHRTFHAEIVRKGHGTGIVPSSRMPQSNTRAKRHPYHSGQLRID